MRTTNFVGMIKLSEDEASVVYAYTTDLQAAAPDGSWGQYRIEKASGAITITKPEVLPPDAAIPPGWAASVIAFKMEKHQRSGTYPDAETWVT
jgi:hypothetical protein